MPPRCERSSQSAHHPQVLVFFQIRRKARIVPCVPSALVAPWKRRRSDTRPRLLRVRSWCGVKPFSPVAPPVVIHTLDLLPHPLRRLRSRDLLMHCGHCCVAPGGNELAHLWGMPSPQRLEQTKYGVQQPRNTSTTHNVTCTVDVPLTTSAEGSMVRKASNHAQP